MNIPLIVKPFIDKYSQEQKLEIWIDGRPAWVKAPFKPYFYSSYPLRLDFLKPNMECSVINKTLFSNLQTTDLYKYSFQNTRFINQYREEDSIEADILYTDRICIDQPDFFTKYPNKNQLRVMYFDIEVDTTGMFPTPDRNAIIAIGAKCGDRKAIYMSESYNDDRTILYKFFDLIKETDPDIISHYNGNGFDIPYMMERMKINHIPLNLWSRNQQDPHIFKNTMSIGGRLSFDIYDEAQRDQTLSGIKNLKMKTLVRWLDKEKTLGEVIEVPYSEMRKMVNTSKLKEYLISDINITEFLFNVYFKNVQMLAEMNNIPLNLMMSASPSFLANIIHGRAFQKLNIVSDKTNGQRHPLYIKNKQGALVDTFAPGLYNHEIYKVDYSSQYPRAAQTFNACYDNITEVLTKDGWKLFKDINYEDKIATLNKDTLEYQNPTDIQSYDYNGKMYNIDSKIINLLVTPNHRMYIRKRYKKFNLIEAQEIKQQYEYKKDCNWFGENIEFFILPSIIHIHKVGSYEHTKYKEILKPEIDIAMDKWLKFFGYYISEGNCYEYNKAYRIFISQKYNSKYYSDIENSIKDIGFKYYKNKDGFLIVNKQLFIYLSQFGKSYEKYIPIDILKLNRELLLILFNSLMNGDGYRCKLYKKSEYLSYSTVSKRLADNMQEIALKIGKSANVYFKKSNDNKRRDRYRIRIFTTCNTPLIKNSSYIDYNDKVYCCTVPNSIIYVRRNGKSVWCGNSPETTKIIRYDPFGDYKFDISNPNKYVFSIPDENAKKNIVIEIDQSRRGFLAKFMDEVLTERFIIKKRMKEVKKGSTEYEYLNVRQNALKVIANVQTGYEGQEFARYGDLGTYCLITGMCRYYIKLSMGEILRQK